MPSANSLTAGPRGTPASLLGARSPGIPAAEPGAWSREDEDGEDLGAWSLRSGGIWMASSVSPKSLVVALPSGSSEAGCLPSLGCAPSRFLTANLLSFVPGMRQFAGSSVCSGCPLGRGLTLPSGFMRVHPGQV